MVTALVVQAERDSMVTPLPLGWTWRTRILWALVARSGGAGGPGFYGLCAPPRPAPGLTQALTHSFP